MEGGGGAFCEVFRALMTLVGRECADENEMMVWVWVLPDSGVCSFVDDQAARFCIETTKMC